MAHGGPEPWDSAGTPRWETLLANALSVGMEEACSPDTNAVSPGIHTRAQGCQDPEDTPDPNST